MKTLITSILLIFSTSVFAQFAEVSVSDPNIKLEADKITSEYNEQLALTGVQIPLFKNKVAHYLVISENIKQQKEGRAELDALVEMQAEESLAMNDILTLLQYRLYQKLKNEIQPLKMVE